MNVTDELLMAYVDGELDAEERVAVEAAIGADPELQRRVARQQALREKLRASFDSVLAEPVPERLIEAARSAPVGSGQVTDLADKRAAKSAAAARRWALPQWAAMAASVVFGVVIAWVLLDDSTEGALFATRDGSMVALGAVADALDGQLASAQAPDSFVQIGVSFRDESNHYCRTFQVPAEEVAGLACKRDDAWRVQALTQQSGEAAGGYRMAAGQMPAAILQAVQSSISGEPLDAEAEEAAQRSDWK